MYTIYAFGNGYLLYGMFQAIALFFKNNNIGVLFTILALIAAIYYAIRVTIYHQHSLLSTAKYVIVFSIILTGLVYNQTTVIINDVSNPAAPTNAQPISNVPWGIAVLWSDFTTIQYGLAKDFTNDFSVPAGDNMLSEGLGVSIIQQADSATISTSNSYLYQDYNQYISNCVAPGISAGYLDVSELLGAGDATDTASQTYNSNAANSIWTVMSTYTSNTATGGGGNLLTEWYSGTSPVSVTAQASGQSDPGGTTTTCSQETTWLQTAVQDYITNNAGPAIAGGLQMASFSDLSNAIGAVNPYIFNMQQGGQAQLMQAIGVNMYAPAILKMAQASGSNASSLAVATGTGEVSTQTGMMESGILAGKYMPIVFGIFEAILLGASVIIFILILTHMGVSYLKLLFQLMIMITIWPSLTAIFNYITQLIIQAWYQPIAGLGYSVSGSGTVNTFLAESLSWMGYFSWSVPMVAYMIASGSSYAVTSVVGSMDSAISKNASVKGAEAGMGNMTAGQIKDNNYLANATNVTHTQNTGYKAPHTTVQEGTKEETVTLSHGITANETIQNGQVVAAQLTQAGTNNVVDLKMGSNGQLEAFNYKGNLAGKNEQSWVAGIKKDISSENKELLSKKEALSSSINQVDSAINTKTAGMNASRGRGVNRDAIVSSGNKTGDQNNYDTKSTASEGMGITGYLGGILSAVFDFNKSNGIMNSVGNGSGAGVRHAINQQMHRLKVLSNANLGSISIAASKELSALTSYDKTLTKIDSYKTDLSEAEHGKLNVEGGIMPSVINNMTPDRSIGGFASTFNKLNNTSANAATLGNFISMTADNYKGMNTVLSGVSPAIKAQGLKLKGETSNLTPSVIDQKVNGVISSNNGEFNYLTGLYNEKSRKSTQYYNKPIAPQGFIKAPTASNISPGSPIINSALNSVETGSDYLIGLSDGITYGNKAYGMNISSDFVGPNGKPGAYWAGVKGGQLLSPYNLGYTLIHPDLSIP